MGFVREQVKLGQQSVVQVEDAQTYLRNVKKHLSDKQGVPSEHHRLTFAVAPAVGTESGSKYLPGSAESLLAGLSTWQALVHQNRKCVGQFFNPRLYSVSQVTDTAFDSQTDKTPVQQLCIIYDSFRAASGTGAQSLLVPLVPACKSEQYRFTVFGRCDNRNFVLPVTYQFSGQQAAYSLQKALYIDKHRHSSAQTSAGVECLSSLTTAKDLTINFGSGFELFSAVFEPQDTTAWLKCLVLKFCLIAQRPLDEASPLLSTSELAVKSCPTFSQPASASSSSLQSSANINMPQTDNHCKVVNKRRKAKGRSQAGAASSPKSPGHAVDTVTVHQQQAQQVGQTASSQQSSSSQRRHRPANKRSMAVPATADSEAVASNGLAMPSTKQLLQGSHRNGFLHSGSEVSSSVDTEADASRRQIKLQHPAESQSQSTLPSEVTDCDSVLEQHAASSSVQHQVDVMSTAPTADAVEHNPASILANGLETEAALQRSSGQAQPSASQAEPVDGKDAGLYAMPEAVQAWAADSAASSTHVQHPSWTSGHWHHLPPGPNAQRQHQQQHRQQHTMPDAANGIQSDAESPHGSSAPSHSAQLPQQAQHAAASTSQVGAQTPWYDRPPPGLSLPHPEASSSWNSIEAGTSHTVTADNPRTSTTGPDYRPAAPPSHTHRSSAQQPYFQQTPVPRYFRHPHHISTGPPTSSLQSLDLANDPWHAHRVSQYLPPPSQQHVRSPRPPAHEASHHRQQHLPTEVNAEPAKMHGSHTYSAGPGPPSRSHSSHTHPRPQPAYAAGGSGLAQGSYASADSFSAGMHPDSYMQYSQQAHDAALLAAASHFQAMHVDARPPLQQGQVHTEQQAQAGSQTDFERLLEKLTPVLDDKPGSALTLGDLWQWFLEPSLYGTDILTMGGSRGPSVSYYVPYLSAMQLLLPVLPQPPQQQPGTPSAAVADEAVEASQHTQQSTAQEAENPAAAEQTQASADVQSQPGGEAALPRAGKLYHVEDHWQQLSSQAQPLLELFDTELPFNRVPMYNKLEELAAERRSAGAPGSLLHSQPLSELHPASWFAVAWYPAYRIPDAPLNGRFLTFHYIQPQSQHQHAVLPIAGLKLCSLHGERWFEPLSLNTLANRQHEGHSRTANARSVPNNVQYQLNALQRGAEYMARGLGLRLTTPRGLERVQQRHPDFEFFHTRH